MNLDAIAHFLFVETVGPFIGRPDRIAFVACGFFAPAVAMYWIRRRAAWPLAIASVLWWAFAGWESFCKAKRYDIRVDLLLLWPAIFFVTVAAVVVAIARCVASPPSDA